MGVSYIEPISQGLMVAVLKRSVALIDGLYCYTVAAPLISPSVNCSPDFPPFFFVLELTLLVFLYET